MRTDVSGREWSATVAAAQAGDRRALEELLEGWLPLVYNVVGRALNGHADVDDVVQETMIRAVDNLGTLRDPDSFRSWLMAIAMRQIRDRARRGKGRRSAEGPPPRRVTRRHRPARRAGGGGARRGAPAPVAG
ncbi:RNA polymerase sigma factor, partial [Streptomyces diastatochromogenes]|uniref:RNA polymerase sigma factor n=1 Tax=Streptomyces diastatochromogenes TaxID=42236 RepID=UPI0036D1BFD1